LPRFLRSLSGAISAGGDLTGSIELVAETEASVVGKEVAEALAQYRMGQPLAKCLHALADRMQNRDLKLLAMALEMQQQTGGSLAKIIGAVLESIDGRVAVEREIRVLTAEGRLSAKILVALPALIALALAILMPDYLAFFVTDPVGLLMLAVALGLLVTGWLWMRRLVRADG
jgi:tight adherence protein B